MKRRDFVRCLGLSCWTAFILNALPFPRSAQAGNLPLRLALLTDAHLPDSNPDRAEARALARAVAEIRNLKPAPDLVLFAGDLAHNGDPSALALGEEILSDLSMPVLAVRGEGDGRPMTADAGRRLFQEGRFLYRYQGLNLLGLDLTWQDGSQGPGFALGEAQQRWLAGLLPRLNPARPLIVLSHAPLIPVYRPWGQWTIDSGPFVEHLSRCENVLLIHGHVHHGCYGEDRRLHSSNRQPLTEIRKPAHLALPATAWPLPSPLTGTPRKLRPGLGPRGCGWALMDQVGPHLKMRPRLWPA